jgi:hypothetical protein
VNVKKLIKGKILAGHQLDCDFKVSVWFFKINAHNRLMLVKNQKYWYEGEKMNKYFIPFKKL